MANHSNQSIVRFVLVLLCFSAFFFVSIHQRQQLELDELHRELANTVKELNSQKIRTNRDVSSDQSAAIIDLAKENEQLRMMLRNCKKERDSCNSNIEFPRRFKRVAIIIPFTSRQTLRTRENLMRWGEMFPCDLKKSYKGEIDLIFYTNKRLGTTQLEHEQVIQELMSLLENQGSIQCFNQVRSVIANLTLHTDDEQYSKGSITSQFFQMFYNPEFVDNYDYFFNMESDSVPIRKYWLDRVYEDIEFTSNFWVKGSIYRGLSKPLQYCFHLCGCAEHMNGNSIYKLGDATFNQFLNNLFDTIDYNSWNYDAYIMHQLKKEDNFRFFQEYAHKFVYTDIIQHGKNDITVTEVLEKYPDTYILHQARFV